MRFKCQKQFYDWFLFSDIQRTNLARVPIFSIAAPLRICPSTSEKHSYLFTCGRYRKISRIQFVAWSIRNISIYVWNFNQTTPPPIISQNVCQKYPKNQFLLNYIKINWHITVLNRIKVDQNYEENTYFRSLAYFNSYPHGKPVFITKSVLKMISVSLITICPLV